MELYQDILESAPNKTYTSAGDLHEEIWIELLKREDSEIHNVRLSRGDCGIDGLRMIDPVLGTVHTYQAKFFPEIGNDEKKKKAITKSFISVHANPLLCEAWTLLVPFKFSAKEIFWLYRDMKPTAIEMLTKMHDEKTTNFKACTYDVQLRRIKKCQIKYMDLDNLLDLLRRHLDIGSKYLPESKLNLLYELEVEKDKNSALDRDSMAILRRIQEDNIRRRKSETQRAISAIKMLNQGWSNFYFQLKQYLRIDEKSDKLQDLGIDIEEFSRSKQFEAFESEGLLPGISDLLVTIHIQSRLLQQACFVEETHGLKQTHKIANKLINCISELQGQIGNFQRELYFQSKSSEGLYNQRLHKDRS